MAIRDLLFRDALCPSVSASQSGFRKFCRRLGKELGLVLLPLLGSLEMTVLLAYEADVSFCSSSLSP